MSSMPFTPAVRPTRNTPAVAGSETTRTMDPLYVASGSPAPQPTWTYLYAIGSAAALGEVFAAGTLPAIDGTSGNVYTLAHGDLVAIVSQSIHADYQGLTRQEALHYLTAHQGVVEAALQQGPLLPVKFGTVLPDAASITRLLEQGADLLRAALARFAQQMQFEIVVLWDLAQVFAEIGSEEPIARLKDQAAALPPIQAQAVRIAVGQAVKEALDQRRDVLATALLTSLREIAHSVVVNPVLDDSMVANIGVLVDEPGYDALVERLDLHDLQFAGRLHLRCVGPLPPYSFATVEVETFAFDEVDDARQQLGLPAQATFAQVRQAYHRLAAQAHPDHNPHDATAASRMAALTQAYMVLRAYAAQGDAAGEPQNGQQCDFGCEAVEQALIFRVCAETAAPVVQ